MKLLRVLLLAAILPLALSAQDIKIKEGNAKMGKKKLWCFSTRYAYDQKITRETMEQNLSEANIRRTSRKKGFSIYKGAYWPALSKTTCDYYYKLKGKKGKTTVYLAVSKGYDNYVTSANDAEISANIVRYLQNLQAQLAKAVLIQEKEQELLQINKKNEEADKQLMESKKQEAEKAKEIQQLRKPQRSADPVK